MTDKFPDDNAPAQAGAEVQRWADVAMFSATPLDVEEGEVLRPKVTLIHMTPNPLRVMAAAAELYAGRVWHSASRIPHHVAMQWWNEMTATKLHAPLEFIDLHFLIEGVTRAFTHQLVRQRTAVYVQESMRFAVKENARWEVALPPSLEALQEDAPQRVVWNQAVKQMSEAYTNLVNSEIPAEDARGLLPTNIGTRIHYKTNLRNLAEHAGLRLCSQAQHEWKVVWLQMLAAIRKYGPDEDWWQQETIVSLFKPICYQTGKCEFLGANDRYCRIRDRVQAHAVAGEPPDTWTDIDPREPLIYGAARLSPEGAKYYGK